MLEVRRLVLLRELDARGSIAAVSRAVGISSSAISQQLAKLEAEVGMTLLDQVGRHVQLTPQHSCWPAARTRSSRSSTTPRPSSTRAAITRRASSASRRSPPMRCVTCPPFCSAWHAPTRTSPSSYLPRGVCGTAELAELRWVFEPFGSDAHLWARRVCRAAGFEPVAPFDSSDLRVHHALVTAGVAAAFLPDMVFRSPAVPLRRPAHRFDWPHRSGEELYRDVHVVTRRGGHVRPAVAALLEHVRGVSTTAPGHGGSAAGPAQDG